MKGIDKIAATEGHSATVTLTAKISYERLSDHISALARLGSSAVVTLHGNHEKIASALVKLGRHMSVSSARVSLIPQGDASPVALRGSAPSDAK